MNINDVVTHEKCTGCGSCVAVCNKNAVFMKKNALDERVSIVNAEKCISCNRCIEVCPVMTIETHRAKKCLAMYSKEKEEQKQSASGGIATVLSRVILKSGIAVCGVVWNDRMEAEHYIVTDLKELSQLQGSKYVESSTGDFDDIKNWLKEGKELLYIGMPCQVAAMKLYCKGLSEKLYTVDLICHGMTPKEYLKQYIKTVSKGEVVSDIKFRGEKDFWFRTFQNEKCIYESHSEYDLYFSAFLEGMIFRENCYSCQYATSERVGDMTLGDFWGLKNSRIRENYEGNISLVLVNTAKGEWLYNQIINECVVEERQLMEALEENKQLSRPSIAHVDRERFKREYPFKGFVKAMKKTSIYKKIKKRKRTLMKTKFKKLIIRS